MKIIQKINKKISIVLIIAILLGDSFGLLIPTKTAEAQYPVIDIANLVQNTLAATNSSLQSGLQQSQFVKDFTLKGIAYGIAKQILRSLTSSVVDWINSGFEGSPAFVTDPASFFTDIADEMIGDFLQSQELTKFLCSPFSIDVRLSLAFRYQPFKRKKTCTLSDIIKNTTNAVQNASINGYTAGDFKQGGWPAFVTMTTEPQNNQYGAYVQAEMEMSARIGTITLQKEKDLDRGKGFLSFNKCKNVPLQDEGANTGATIKKCEVVTPGSVISNQLEMSLGSPIRQLELADDINEIVNALFAQMVKQVLIGGLSSLSSGGGSGGSQSYTQRLQSEQESQASSQFNSTKSNFITALGRVSDTEKRLRDVQLDSINKINSAKSAYEEVMACYESNKVKYPKNAGVAQQAIDYIKDIININILPASAPILPTLKKTEDTITSLDKIMTQINKSATINDLIEPSNTFNQISGSEEVVNAEVNYLNYSTTRDNIYNQMNTYIRNATTAKAICGSFSDSTTNVNFGNL